MFSINKYGLNRVSYWFMLVAVAALVLQGCATSPGASYEPAPGHRIGVLNLVEESYTHTHVGTTVFNNKVDAHDYDQLNVHEYITARVINDLEARSLQALIIRPGELPGLSESDLVGMGWNDYRIRPEHVDDLEAVMAEHGLSLLLVFESFQRQDHVGGSSVHIGGYGLYTRSFFGAGASRAYSNVWGYGIRSNPVAYVAAGGTRTTRDVEFSSIDESTIRALEAAVQPIIDEVVNNTFANVGID